jgi:Xaa-Pro aminopeptidase
MLADRFPQRRDKLLHRIRAANVGALLVSNPTNVSYLTGFSGDSSFLLFGPGFEVLISDGRYTTQIAEECPGLEMHIRTQKQTILDAAAAVIGKARLHKLAIEGDDFTVAALEKLKSLPPVKEVEFISTSGQVEELRQVKDADEIAELREAIYQAEKGLELVRAGLGPDQTELQVAHDLEHAMRRFGARVAAFPPIVAVGPRAALPHARPTEARIGSADFVLIDWGAVNARGYHSDLTRVFVTGKISTKLERVYGVVLKAQQAAIAAIRPGVKCREVDAVARRVIEEAGFGKRFTHGTGHGIGLDIHESPRFSVASEVELKPGMVVTVEPGIYLPGWGGVRIEDDVLVTRQGHEVLTSVPRHFEHCLIS